MWSSPPHRSHQGTGGTLLKFSRFPSATRSPWSYLQKNGSFLKLHKGSAPLLEMQMILVQFGQRGPTWEQTAHCESCSEAQDCSGPQLQSCKHTKDVRRLQFYFIITVGLCFLLEFDVHIPYSDHKTWNFKVEAPWIVVLSTSGTETASENTFRCTVTTGIEGCTAAENTRLEQGGREVGWDRSVFCSIIHLLLLHFLKTQIMCSSNHHKY